MKLLSIHVPSNKPWHFRRLVENLYTTSADPRCFEIVVKIDTEDAAMHQSVATIRKDFPNLNLTVVVSSPPASYFHVWQCMQEILDASDPEYYFCWHINDEILIETHNWDLVLGKYIGFFPDHFFRLKVSSCKFFNFYQIYDTCWGGDYPIIPRKWLQVSGNWCDFHGADSYQEGIAFYLGRYAHIHRNVPLLDFVVGGDPPGENMPPEAIQARTRGIIKHWDESNKHVYQEDYFRRARRIELAVLAYEKKIDAYEIEDDRILKLVILRRKTNNEIIAVRSFRRSGLAVWWEHFLIVVNRGHPDDLVEKPLWFSFLYRLARILRSAFWLLRKAGQFANMIMQSLWYDFRGQPENSPLRRLRLLVEDGALQLHEIVPSWAAKIAVALLGWPSSKKRPERK